MMELFFAKITVKIIFSWLSTCAKKAPSRMFDRVFNTPVKGGFAMTLTNFMLLVSSYTPENIVLLKFSGGKERNQWHEMG